MFYDLFNFPFLSKKLKKYAPKNIFNYDKRKISSKMKLNDSLFNCVISIERVKTITDMLTDTFVKYCVRNSTNNDR